MLPSAGEEASPHESGTPEDPLMENFIQPLINKPQDEGGNAGPVIHPRELEFSETAFDKRY